MAKENIKALCLRFDLADEDERKAYDHLQNRDKVEFGSYTKLVSRAVNEFFERRSKLKDDPYFETREKEDAFIARVLDSGARGATTTFVENGQGDVATFFGQPSIFKDYSEFHTFELVEVADRA